MEKHLCKQELTGDATAQLAELSSDGELGPLRVPYSVKVMDNGGILRAAVCCVHCENACEWVTVVDMNRRLKWCVKVSV